jgi:mono/diheme cytochrome c family protein
MRHWLVLAASLALACNGDTDTSTDDTDTDTGATVEGPPLSQVYDDVLVSCAFAGCHGLGSASGSNGLEFSDASSAHAALVGVASAGAPSETFVIAGNPDGSYLVKKLENASGITGGPMPPPAGGLDPAQIQLVRDWIAAGALDN